MRARAVFRAFAIAAAPLRPSNVMIGTTGPNTSCRSRCPCPPSRCPGWSHPSLHRRVSLRTPVSPPGLPYAGPTPPLSVLLPLSPVLSAVPQGLSHGPSSGNSRISPALLRMRHARLCTRVRFGDAHTCPLFSMIRPHPRAFDRFLPASPDRLHSSVTISGSFPPSSSTTSLMSSAASFWISAPAAVLPVSARQLTFLFLSGFFPRSSRSPQQ